MRGEDGPTPRLEVRELSLELDGRRVLDRVGLHLNDGETLVILGGSGAGKSMLLRTIVRLQTPTGGQVLLDGRDVCLIDPQELRRRVGLVQQQPAMLEGTVEENLRFGLDLMGVTPGDIEERVRAALADASLDEGFLARKTSKLSGGERQRVAIARALAMGPSLLLLDEPTAALDPRTKRSLEDTVLRLKRERRFTMLVVTHDIEQAQRLGDRTVLMRMGMVVASGRSDKLMEELDPKERDLYIGELRQMEDEDKEDGPCD